MKSRALLLIALATCAAAPLAAQCVPSWNVLQQQTTADYVHISVDANLSSAAATAINMWDGCATGGTMRPQLPYATTGPISGATFTQLNIKYYSGFNPTNNTSCAQFPGHSSGQDMDVYEKAYDPGGNEVQCSSFGYDFIIAHEMGHFYHLADTGGSCTDIMGQANGLSHSLTTDDCTQAKDVNHTLNEDAPYDYTCWQPCYTYCYGGNCPAQNGGSPIIMNLDGGTPRLTGPDDPVLFDLFNEGHPMLTAWTDGVKSDTVFLCDDLNGNGRIDDGTELFGISTRLLSTGQFAHHGYEALAEYDRPEFGGNGDGKITKADALYARLLVWRDQNHNGLTTPDELRSLADAGIVSIDVTYKVDHRRDQYGNQFFYRGQAAVAHGAAQRVIETYDVLFARGSTSR
jgi:hypothetical protein